MSKAYPCVHCGDGGICYKHTDGRIVSYCVMGPCPDERPSNGDYIRQMTDEKLAEWCHENCICPPPIELPCRKAINDAACAQCWLDWLRKEETE